MDFAAIVIFLLMYYIRPQEIFSLFSSLHPAALSMLMGIVGIALREKEFSWKELFKTPHDWVMFALIGWIVYASPDSWSTWSDVKSYLIFYVVIVLSLTTIERLKKFLVVWTIMILGLSLVGLAGFYGFDPLDSASITERNMGRLCINLSIFANPNAVGHNIVPGIMMAYFAFMWARPIFMQQLGSVILIFPLWCVFLTASKGAFLSGFFTSLASFIFGRHFVVQVIVVILAASLGWAALFTLPRMGALTRRASSDPGIAQRIMLWQFGWQIYNTDPHGVGYMNWWGNMYRTWGWVKAPHSGYIQVGAELGKKGFYLYLAVLYCCLRTLVFAKTANKEEERVRRMLMVLTLGYTVSTWMIDFGYRPTYFMFAAGCGAFHRILYYRGKEQEQKESEETVLLPQWKPATAGGPAVALPGMTAMMSVASPATVSAPGATSRRMDEDDEDNIPVQQGIKWKYFGVIDFVMVYLMVRVWERWWLYSIQNM